MNVCIFTETFHPVIGGGETQARLLAEGLIRHGHDAFILTRRSDAALARHDTVGRVPVHRLAPSGRGQLRKWGLLVSSLPALLRLRRQYDLVFVSGFRIIGLAAVISARLLGKRVVLKADSQGEMSGDFFTAGLARIRVPGVRTVFRLFLRLRNAILRDADGFAAITDDAAAELIAAGVDPAVVHRIPNAVDTSRFSPPDSALKERARRDLRLPPDARIVAYTGRLVSYKGLPLLLRVWAKLHPEHPDAVLLLIGTGGLDIHACEEELRASVRENGLESSVIFTGSVGNVHEYLQAADVFAFPSENDAFPSALIEAMTTALPVVATRVGAIPEIVRDGENGLLIEARDFDGLEVALRRLLTDDELGGRLGRAGSRTVQERYAAERVTQRYIDLFDSVIASAATRPERELVRRT